MKLVELESAVRAHAGEFLCEQIGAEGNTKVVRFRHAITAASATRNVPSVGGLRDFYETFGSIVFYHDPKSGDAARHLAPHQEWPELQSNFDDWIEDVAEDERADFIPGGTDHCLVIGETPRSGNYILVPTKGPAAGQVFEFDHDGFEFRREGIDIVEYVEKLLAPDSARLSDMASHLRFVEGEDWNVQWWIREMRDNRGRVVLTKI